MLQAYYFHQTSCETFRSTLVHFQHHNMVTFLLCLCNAVFEFVVLYLAKLFYNIDSCVILGGKPDPEKVFQASQVQQAINSVKSVLYSPQVVNSNSLRAFPKSDSTSSSTPIHTVSMILYILSDRLTIFVGIEFC